MAEAANLAIHYEKFYRELQDFIYQPQNLSSTLLQIFGMVLKHKSTEKNSERYLELFKKVDKVFDGFCQRKFFLKGKETTIKTYLILNFGVIFLEEDLYEAQAQKCMEILMRMKLKLTEIENLPPDPYVPATIGHFCEKYLSYFRHKMEFTDQFRIIDKVLQAHNSKKSLSYGVCLFVKSTIYIAAKDFTNGKKLLKEALSMCQSPSYERSQITARLADCYRLSGSYEKALLQYRRAKDIVQDSIQTHVLQHQLGVKCLLRQGECHWLMNEHSKAREMLGALNQKADASIKAFLMEDKGRGIDAEDDWNQCYKRISDAITSREAHPDQDIEAKIQLSYKLVDDVNVLNDQKKYWDALELLKKVYALKKEINNGEITKSDLKVLIPYKLKCLNSLIYNHNEDQSVVIGLHLERACTFVEQIQQLSDDVLTNVRYCNYHAGASFCTAEYWPEGAKYIKKAIKKEEGDKKLTPYKCFHTLGICYYELGRLKKSHQYLRASSWGIDDKHQDFLNLQGHLARSHYYAKNFDEVKKVYELMLKSKRTGKYGDDAWHIKILHSRSLIAQKQYRDAINILSNINKPNGAIEDYKYVIVHILLCLCYRNSDNPYDEDLLYEQMEILYAQHDFSVIHSVLKEFHFQKNDLHSFLDLSKECLEDQEDKQVPDYMLFVNSSYITGMFRRKRMGYDDTS